jgi:hypothetical protein
MSEIFQTVVLGPNLNDFGKRPLATPAHHVDFDTGITVRTFLILI